jgi:hypothetical protein
VDWASGTAYTTIGQVRDVDGPSVSRDPIEVPFDHDMSGGDYQLKFAGVPTAGPMTFSLNWDPKSTIHSQSAGGLLESFDDYYNGTSLPAWQYQNAQITGGTATWTFDGFVSEMSPNMGAVQGSLEAELTVEISGKPILTIT